MDQNKSRDYFCYLTVNNEAEMIIQSVMVGCSVLLVGYAFLKYYRMRGSHNAHVTCVYSLLAFWWLTYLASNIFSIALFDLHDKNPDSYPDESMSTLTKYFFVVEWVNAYTIQWLLLYMPFQWAKQISEIFDSTLADQSEVEFVEPSNYNGYETRIYKCLKYYMRIRLLYIPLAGVFLGLEDEVLLFKIMVTCLLIDCLFITVSLVLGMYSLKTTQQLQEQLDQEQSKRTFNQYLMFIFANTIRFAIDLVTVISRVFGDQTYSSKCPDTSNDSFALELTLNIVTCILTFYLPIFIILRIYNLQEKPQIMCQSLLISHENNQEQVSRGSK